MNEQECRDLVVKIAREWICTPFVHEGRIKGKCADCTFLAAVFVEAGLMPEQVLNDIPHYSPQAHVSRGGAVYQTIVKRYAKREITQAEALPGDIALFNIGRAFGHGGLIIPPGWPHIIHADMNARYVMEGNAGNLGKTCEFYSMFG